jgi:hypothetical protein
MKPAIAVRRGIFIFGSGIYELRTAVMFADRNPMGSVLSSLLLLAVLLYKGPQAKHKKSLSRFETT